MKKAIFAVLFTVCLAVSAFAGTYTITTTDDQEAGLTWARGQNTETISVTVNDLVMYTPKYPDNQAYLAGVASAALDGYAAQKKAADLPTYIPMKDAYEKLSPEDQAKVNAILGVGK